MPLRAGGVHHTRFRLVVAAAAGSPRFVGGHPIAGSEARGPEHANAELFRGATWFLTPTAQTEAAIWASPWATGHYNNGAHWSYTPVTVVKAPASAW